MKIIRGQNHFTDKDGSAKRCPGDSASPYIHGHPVEIFMIKDRNLCLYAMRLAIFFKQMDIPYFFPFLSPEEARFDLGI